MYAGDPVKSLFFVMYPIHEMRWVFGCHKLVVWQARQIQADIKILRKGVYEAWQQW